MMSQDPAQAVQAYFTEHPRGMTLVAARELGVPEADVLRHMPIGGVRELDCANVSAMIERLAEFGRVHVIVSNGSTTIESHGEFGNFSTWGGFFNVQTKSLDMHIKHEQITAVFAVEKPGHLDGVSTLSVQFYDDRGGSSFKVFLTFGNKAPSDELRGKWEAYCEEFAAGG
ncbi:MAG: ChuX/HutX family heme-like substrate-binding protein [Pirellulales bacterium]